MNDDRLPYQSTDDDILARAIVILSERLKRPGFPLSSPESVKLHLRLHFDQQEHESFVVLFLDVKNRLIAQEVMFKGTLTHTSVYPREVVKAVLRHNAASVILGHNHPSGMAEPSAADVMLTSKLKEALALIDTRVLDHIIVAGGQTHSFAEHGQI